jgi:hypothetical protein
MNGMKRMSLRLYRLLHSKARGPAARLHLRFLALEKSAKAVCATTHAASDVACVVQRKALCVAHTYDLASFPRHTMNQSYVRLRTT